MEKKFYSVWLKAKFRSLWSFMRIFITPKAINSINLIISLIPNIYNIYIYIYIYTSILLYGCTTWTLTKRLKKKLDCNYTRMLRAILNKSWRQHPTRHQLFCSFILYSFCDGTSQKLYKINEPDTQDTPGEAKTNSSVMYSYGPLHIAKQKQDDQLEHTYSSYVMIRDVAL